MPSSQKVPDLESFLTKLSQGPCSYVRTVPAELRATITAKVNEGVHSWAGFERWLAACGHPVGKNTVSYHYTRRHDDEA